MSDVEEISPEAWADACDSRGDLFTATVIRRLVAERDEARAERDQWESLLYSHSHTIERFRAERDEALGEATRLADLNAAPPTPDTPSTRRHRRAHSERVDGYLHREAEALAREWAPRVTVNGWTAKRVMEGTQ